MTDAEARQLLERALASLLQRSIVITPGERDHESLRHLGVSSLMLFQLVSILEDLGGFAFDDADVDSENFATVGRVLGLLARYMMPPVPIAESEQPNTQR